MKKTLVQRTYRFDQDQIRRLEALAAQHKRSVPEFMRYALDQFLNGHAALSASQLRLARVCEYTQAAIDTILREDHPEHRQLVIDETARRMERYHGA